MNKVIISPKYQIVIPKEIREKTGLKVGGHLEIIHYGNRIELIPIEPIKKLKGFLKGMDTKIEREGDRV
ncbi:MULTISPECIES: AbrB/MazE/SpoVT family DNA-binding domain-containing protein [Leptospira]|uniref:AbrB/MazE/SpoVT family DNA-binding domain-containing protein n=2 Tax=Leptospira interrogans TaxID=173 RepID=A0AAP9WHI9_LEPIR|nr:MULTISPECIES: AbrB/MazE/SpoVT family DNA-binding domain-containing protein [Leptospira]EMM97868.1 transcriptional regulator, AbrB family [Leptospira interrogans serovar Zanoni str. LT2156]AJR16674.1 Antitoxin-MazE superfamily [Leptospira interrogans serovar Linhai str. 56609]EKR34337.1 transcriptional regulator, AbrB family [Leptospira interrogans serovar Hebdomadis str. R499]EKR82535.1 transcriptional regulator, AbrB family [Leptospira interrogans str. UI 08452]EMN33154.1 transcriptional r